MDSTTRLITLLARLAYREGDVVLASGRRSSYYLDAKQVTYHPDGVELVGDAVLRAIRPYHVAAVGGPTMGADAIVVSTVAASRRAGEPLVGFIVRKDAKEYGLQKRIEGVCPPPGTPVAIVDDVATSGGSMLRAVHAARDAGLDVVVAVPLVDRLEGGAEALAAEGVDFHPVCTIEEVRAAAPRARGVTGSGSGGGGAPGMNPGPAGAEGGAGGGEA